MRHENHRPAHAKGRLGKSTTARELAVSAGLAGVRVALADLDPQGTTTGWYKRRKAETPPLVRYDPANAAPLAGVEWLVIDTPPGAPAYMPALLARADLVLVPVRPSLMICWPLRQLPAPSLAALGRSLVPRFPAGHGWLIPPCASSPPWACRAGSIRLPY